MTPPGKLWGVAVAVGAQLVRIGAMRHVAGVWPGPAFLRLAQGHTIYENTPVSGLPTVIDKRFAGSSRAHGVAALGPCLRLGWVVTSKRVHLINFASLGTVRIMKV